MPFLFDLADKIYDVSKNSLKEELFKPSLFFTKTKGARNHLFSPLVLLMTNNCNGRCLYCYAGADQKNKVMDFILAKTIIDASLLKQSQLDIYLFGGGEPTLAFDLMKRIGEYVSAKKDKQIHLYLTTNGFFSRSIKEWIPKNIERVSISCDGPAYIQNKHRPLKNGGPSSLLLEKNVSFLLKKGVPLGFRTTLTADSIDKQDEILEYAFRLGLGGLLFSPFRESVKSRKNNVHAVDYRDFIKGFLKTKELAEMFGMKLISDFFPVESRKSMCGFESPNQCVSPSGSVATCWASSIGYTDIPDIFTYGKVGRDGKIKKDILSWKRIAARTPENIPECCECFLKWSCAGGCAASHYQVTGDIMKVDKKQCDAIKMGVKDYLLYVARKKHKKFRPSFKKIGDKTYFITYFNRFETGRKNKMELNPIIEIKDFNKEALTALSRAIIKHRDKRGYTPTLFFLRFVFSHKEPSVGESRKIAVFLKTLLKNKIHFISTPPLSKDILLEPSGFYLC